MSGRESDSERAERVKRQAGWPADAPKRPTKPYGVKCDICTKTIPVDALAIDGKTVHGPWANMCEDCFTFYGVGLGLGKGQTYRVVPAK